MLFNTKWERPADVFSLESLIAWLEKQPARTVYCYMDNDGCLLSQYFRAAGFDKVHVGGETVFLDGYDHGNESLPDSFADLAVGRPRTFGAALNRAREFAERLS